MSAFLIAALTSRSVESRSFSCDFIASFTPSLIFSRSIGTSSNRATGSEQNHSRADHANGRSGEIPPVRPRARSIEVITGYPKWLSNGRPQCFDLPERRGYVGR